MHELSTGASSSGKLVARAGDVYPGDPEMSKGMKKTVIGERWIIAQHAGAPEPTLKALMLDEEEFICSQAEAQLKSRGL